MARAELETAGSIRRRIERLKRIESLRARMDTSTFTAFYLLGIGLNAVAFVHALNTGSTLFAGTFALVIVYLSVRYRLLRGN